MKLWKPSFKERLTTATTRCVYRPAFGWHCNRSVPLPFPGNAAILAAIPAGRMPTLPGGSERLLVLDRIHPSPMYTIGLCISFCAAQ